MDMNAILNDLQDQRDRINRANMLSKAPHQTANGDEALCQRAARITDGDADGGCRQPAERESLKQRKRGGLKQRRLAEISSDPTPRQFPSQPKAIGLL